MNRLGRYLRRAAPTMLTCLAGVGVIATAVLASKAAVKAKQMLDEASEEKGDALTKMEALKTAAPAYISTVAAGGATVAFVFGANVLNRRQQIALAGAYAFASDRFRRYRAKVKDICGEEAHQKVLEELAVEKCRDVSIMAPVFTSNSCLDFQEDEERHIFYDSFGERYFESTFSNVLQAEYHLNRNYVLGGNVALNDFYEFLGLEPTGNGNDFGWSMASGYSWIDFNHRKTALADGTPCYLIEALSEPDADFADW